VKPTSEPPTTNNTIHPLHDVCLPTPLLPVRRHARYQHLLQPLPTHPVHRVCLNLADTWASFALSFWRATLTTTAIGGIAISGGSQKPRLSKTELVWAIQWTIHPHQNRQQPSRHHPCAAFGP
jgi:hypothetical protein